MKKLMKLLGSRIGLKMLMRLAKIGIFRELAAKIFVRSINSQLVDIFNKKDTDKLRRP